MKLLYKNILVNAGVSLIVILLGGFITYSFIINKIKEEAKEHLLNEKRVVEQKLKIGTPISIIENNIGDKIEVEQTTTLVSNTPVFKTFVLKEENEEEGEEEEELGVFTSLSFGYQSNSDFYKVTIIKMTDNDEELAKNILLAVVLSTLLMISTIAFVNAYIYTKLWSPFYQTLKSLQRFNISKHDALKLPQTNTEEFSKLNRSITLMSKKISEDYFSLKEFTENASHEIQTPLAVIQSKIEMCLQDEHLSPEQATLLIEANQAVNTLVSLNKGLITLAKLDNNQIDEPSEVNIYDKIMKRLNAYEDFIQDQDIDVEMRMDKNVTVQMNPSFAIILFDNLIKNAVKHNLPQGGKISIEVTPEMVKISNTGLAPKADTSKFFERFYKGSQTGSLGLGLAIVKKICDIYSFKIGYQYLHGLHVVTLELK